MKVTVELNPLVAIPEAISSLRLKMKRRAHEARRDALLTRAKMNIFQWNTRVVRPTAPEGFSIMVDKSFDHYWGDCVGIGIHYKDDAPGVWRYANFSPARARLIAEHLIQMADYFEREEPSSMNIDKDEEKAAA